MISRAPQRVLLLHAQAHTQNTSAATISVAENKKKKQTLAYQIRCKPTLGSRSSNATGLLCGVYRTSAMSLVLEYVSSRSRFMDVVLESRGGGRWSRTYAIWDRGLCMATIPRWRRSVDQPLVCASTIPLLLVAGRSVCNARADASFAACIRTHNNRREIRVSKNNADKLAATGLGIASGKAMTYTEEARALCTHRCACSFIEFFSESIPSSNRRRPAWS